MSRRRIALGATLGMLLALLCGVATMAVSETTAPSASPGLPDTGASYVYEWSDRRWDTSLRRYAVKVTSVEGGIIGETLDIGAAAPVDRVVDAGALVFLVRKFEDDKWLVEFSPYLTGRRSGEIALDAERANHPGDPNGHWTFSVSDSSDDVEVPAGRFSARRIEINGTREPLPTIFQMLMVVQRFRFVAWYSPQAKRYVKAQYEAWNYSRQELHRELIELIEFKADVPLGQSRK